ncbi:hypothetical protein CCAX7_63500 [Capsulimonas corticalis]|uniref:Uncharacterized protein n=1 Tax=Capsulimonas corticalis TaxID=2219043 RepID=A0A402CWX2_9BACT|nr:PAS domain S-box protein [Capsulimonas corticalis]BDI34299.1 hypothetical protein CCAX7_63500 [Capsulimonas corticalis]
MTTEFPTDESQRLMALRQYGVLDTPPEERYDNITELAAALCDVPITLVSLVDAERQWFKSKVGITIDETHRRLSFCAHTIRQQSPMIINDASSDPRFADNDLVTGAPYIRFYAGFPLTNSEGYALGTLCAIDTKPRDLTPAQFKAMKVLTQQVLTELELRRCLDALGRSYDQARRSEDSARTLKAAILDASIDAIITIDSGETVLEWNPASEKVFGYSRDEAIGRPLSGLIVLSSHDDRSEPEIAQLIGSEQDPERSARLEVIGVGKDGRSFPVEMSAVAVPLDDRLLFTIYLRDITERKQTEAENARLLAKTQTDALWRWGFLRDVLKNVTNGKLRLAENSAELPPRPANLIPITRETLPEFRHRAIHAAEAAEFTKDRIYDLATAVSETAMNAVVHARDGQGCVSISDDGVIQVWIEDRGQGIHIDHLPRAMLEKGYTTADSFGHGLKLTLQTADRVWLLTNSSGTTIVVEKDREEPIPPWLIG